MPLIEETVTIQRALFDVFKAVTDFEALPTWQTGARVRVTAGDPVRAGTMISIQRGSVFINADVLEYQRHKGLVLQGVWGRFRFRRSYEFISNAGRETVIKDKLDIQTGWLYFWYAPFLRSMISSQVRADWARLKQQLEQGGGAGASTLPPA